ncbi:MAG: phage baseplate upper protein [Tetragenococcus halophilus]|nr:phage baseplate upper protein [Tetragenococcus halophilus]
MTYKDKNELYKDIALEVTIDAKRGAKNQEIKTHATFYSYDVQSGLIKINIKKDGAPMPLPNGTQVLISAVKLDLPQQKMIFNGDIVDNNNGIAHWIIPDKLQGYKGDIRAGVFIKLPNDQRLHGGYFRFHMGISEIDENLVPFEENYWQGWDTFQKEAEQEWNAWKEIQDQKQEKQEEDYAAWQKFFEDNREIIESVDPNGTLMTEIVEARRPKVKQTFSRLGERLDNFDSRLLNTREAFLKNLDKIELLGKTGTRDVAGDTKFPQGFAINENKGVYYMIRQTTNTITDQTLYEYDLKDDTLIRQKLLPVDSQAFIEGLVFRSNGKDEIEFIIPLGRQGGSYVIYNLDTNEVSDVVEMEMSNKNASDNTGRYFATITTDTPNQDPNNYANGVDIYDLDSVFAGDPKLLKHVGLLRETVLGDYKIQGFTMIEDMLLFSQGSDRVVTTITDLEGNITKRLSLDKTDLVNSIGFKTESAEDTIVEPEGATFFVEEDKVYLVELICANGKAHLVLHGMRTPEHKKVKTALVQTNNLSSFLNDAPERNMMKENGAPIIDLSKDEDLFEAIEELTRAGFYFVVSNAATKNTPYGASTSTGWIYVRSVASATGKASRAVVELTDGSNRKFSITYDTGYTQKWTAWQQTAGVPVNGTTDLMTLSNINNDGKYLFSAAESRKMPDMPEKYVSLGTLIEQETINSSLVIQKATRLNSDTGNTMPAQRILQNGSAAVGGNTDKFGWKYIVTAPEEIVIKSEIEQIKQAIIDLGGSI